MSGSFIDYDELECKVCGHIGMIPDGGFDVSCPACDAEYSLLDGDPYEDDSDGEADGWGTVD